jgi:integrase
LYLGSWTLTASAAAWCGLRRGEVIGLRPHDVDLAGGTVTVRNEAGSALVGHDHEGLHRWLPQPFAIIAKSETCQRPTR